MGRWSLPLQVGILSARTDAHIAAQVCIPPPQPFQAVDISSDIAGSGHAFAFYRIGTAFDFETAGCGSPKFNTYQKKGDGRQTAPVPSIRSRKGG
jgi:hypothetical protein